MKFLMSAILFAGIAMASMAAQAETRTLQIWTCTLNDGKTAADVQVMNAKWLKYVKTKVTGGDVRSFVLTPATGNLGEFMFIDSYPNFEAWAQQHAAMATPDGVALEAEFNGVNTCASSNLVSSTES